MKTALLQQRIGRDRSENLDATVEAIRRAAGADARLIVLPELHMGPYFCQSEDHRVFDLAETIPGPTTQRLAELVRELGVVLVASLFERRAPGIYHNTAVIFDADGSMAGTYRKMHIPDDPGYYEKFYFTPGDLGFTPVRTRFGVLGVLVCWDQWFPEAARLMALAGAELLIYPTAIGWDVRDAEAERMRQRDAWVTIQRGHAIANGLPLISCNRTGFEADDSGVTEGTQFWGSSFVCGPQGEFLAQASADQAEMLIADIDIPHSEAVRRVWPFLRDRRIDAYADLLKRYVDPA